MIKKTILLFFFLFLGAARTTLAADFNVSCSGGDCTSNGLSPLFSEDNWAPGMSVTRTFSVVNGNGSDSCDLNLNIKNEKQKTVNLAQRLFTVIQKEGGEVFGKSDGLGKAAANKTLADLFSQRNLFWESIPAGQTRAYNWTVTFDPLADNAYQNAKVTFDFDLNFSCGSAPGPTSTPVPGCSEPTSGLPTNFQATSGPGADQATLTWAVPNTPYSYFLVAYSDNPNWPPKWGNPDVGNATSFVVSGLGTGTYYFWLRAGNGCMSGDFVGPIAVSASGAGGVASGFQSGVLGVKTEEEKGTLGGGISTTVGGVAGAVASVCPFWWIVLLGQTIILGISYYFWSKRKKLPRFWYLVPITLVLLAFLIDRYAHTHWYSPSHFCRFELLMGMILAYWESAVLLYWQRKKS
ncbi:MAG: hypothetical protein M1514_01955 [Patescibacteria group bacterium]|nr:hypothetical protein [Patescibacteria group bacterium]